MLALRCRAHSKCNRTLGEASGRRIVADFAFSPGPRHDHFIKFVAGSAMDWGSWLIVREERYENCYTYQRTLYVARVIIDLESRKRKRLGFQAFRRKEREKYRETKETDRERTNRERTCSVRLHRCTVLRIELRGSSLRGGYEMSTQQSPAALQPAVDREKVYTWIIELSNPETRENALLELSKKREVVPDLAPMLWHSFGTTASLLQEIINIYPAINPATLTAYQSNRVCNALALLQCVASHPETRSAFLQVSPRCELQLQICQNSHQLVENSCYKYIIIVLTGSLYCTSKILFNLYISLI